MTTNDVKPVKKPNIQWFLVMWYLHLHIFGAYGIILLLTTAKWTTVLFTLFITLTSILGVTAGAHRLWAHRSYQASGLLKFFLMMAHTMAGVGPIYDWVLAHRMHHQFYGTEHDPYNHKYGFVYSHYISNVIKYHPEYDKMKASVDMRDLEKDLYIWIQKNFYWILFPIFGVLLPLNAPFEYWDESLTICFCCLGFLRFVLTVNASWLVNSAVLIWGVKMEEKIPPSSYIVFFVTKSCWPIYHYMVPWDWKSGEYGSYNGGCSTFFIKMWSELGLVSELQTTTSEEIRDILYEMVCNNTSWKENLAKLENSAKLRGRTEKLKTFL